MFLFAFLFAALIVVRGIVPLPIGWGWKVALSLLAVLCAFKFQLTRLLGGPMFFAPELPGWFLLVSAWGYAIVFFLFFLLLGRELLLVVLFFCKVRSPQLPHLLTLGMFVLSTTLATVGIWLGTRVPAVREVNLTLPSLPAEAEGMTIAVLADLHADTLTTATRIEKLVRRANDTNPDLIVILGDFVDGTVARRSQELLPLRELSAPMGVFGVPGNHEYYSGYDEWMEFLPTLGLRMLPNERMELSNGIVLAGVTDPASKRMGGELPDLAKALDGLPQGKCVILLSHQPILAKEAAEQGVALQFSGHTHGGMVWGLDRLVGRFNGGFYSGLYHIGEMLLYVSNGSSIWNGFPVRIGHNSEITLVRLAGTNP